MIRSFCIKTNNNKIIKDMLFEFENSEQDNLYITSKTFKNFKNIILHYKGEDLSSFYALIAGVLTNIITKHYEELLIKKLLISNYYYFSKPDLLKIFKNCREALIDDMEARMIRVNHIFSSCFDYIKNNKCLILDGFVNFRLKEYTREIDQIIDEAVDRFILDREYNEFTSLLKMYVNNREAEEEIIHIIYQPQEATLLDKKFNAIDTSSDIFNAKFLSDISFSTNDYALNALLNMLPKKIIIHLIDSTKDEFIETIELIFDGRTYICNNCNVCNVYKALKSDEHKIITKE